MRSSDVGITKQAVSAARMRYIVSSLPENLARKKLGNARYDRIRKEIDSIAANKRNIAYDDGYATLIQPRLKSVFGTPSINSKGRYQNSNWLKGTTDAKDLRSSYQLDGAHWRDVKRSLFPARATDSHNVVSRDDLIAMHRATNTPLNEGDLVHDYYFNLFPSRPTNPGSAAAAKAMKGGKKDEQLPSMDYMRRMVGAMRSLPYDSGGTWRAARNNKITRVAANDIQHAPGDAFTYIDSQGLLERTPRSIKTTLSRLDGQNILEPGTRANALYERLRRSNNPKLRGLVNKVIGRDDAYVDLIERGGQAGYLPGAGVTMVSPKTKGYSHVNAHERSHEAFHKMAPEEHAAVTGDLARRLMDVGMRNGLNIPWDNPKLMQEALADGYRMMKGGPGGSVDAARLARWNLNANADGMARIDRLKGAGDVEKEMLRQLYANYNHDIFNRSRNLP